LSHESISSADLASGRFDGARVAIGIVDWETLENHVLYRGAIGSVIEEGSKFTAQLVSRKAELQHDPVPRTSPTCRAVFCGPGCTLSAVRYTHRATVTSAQLEQNALTISTSADTELFLGGAIRVCDGPLAGQSAEIISVSGAQLVLGTPLDQSPAAGTRLRLTEGCDRTIATCSGRFANGINFQGEPYLPGNDMIARYPSSST
jgi:uncharacterized phage protein (TIGR02218 family)